MLKQFYANIPKKIKLNNNNKFLKKNKLRYYNY